MVSYEQLFPEGVLGSGAPGEQQLPQSQRGQSDMPTGVPVIKVMGVGGGGCNAISRMYKEKLSTVEYYGVNTDIQHLSLIHI